MIWRYTNEIEFEILWQHGLRVLSISLCFIHTYMCCCSTLQCKWTVMLSISGRAGLVVIRGALLCYSQCSLSSVSWDLCYMRGRVCQHVCACIVCDSHCTRSSRLCQSYSGRIHSWMKITGLAFEKLYRHTDHLYIKTLNNYLQLPINSSLMIWNVPKWNCSPVAVCSLRWRSLCYTNK